MTLELQDDYEQSRKKNSEARRNPRASAGTSTTLRYMRGAVDMEMFTPGLGKILNNFGKGVMIGEEEIHGIEDIIESNPDVTITDNNTGYSVRIRADTKGEAEHFDHKDTQKLLKKTRGFGYRRLGMKRQKEAARINPKLVFLRFINATMNILRPTPAEVGRLLGKVFEDCDEINATVNTMEKTTGRRYIHSLHEGTEALELYGVMHKRATSKRIEIEKVGDSHLAIIIEEMVGAVDE